MTWIMKRALWSMVLFWVLSSGCSLLSPEEPSLRLKTDRESYALSAAEEIVVEAENTSKVVIYFSTCMPTTLEELEKNRVVATLVFPVCECICPAELEPREKWSHSVPLAWIEANRDQLRLQGSNTYRLRLAFFDDSERRQSLSEGNLYTNRFALVE